jgi:hypothetical protein
MSDQETPQSPAKITALHRQDRELSTVAGAPKGWRKESVLQSVYDRGFLAGGSNRYSAMQRRDAGEAYSEIFDTAQASGRDSTQALNISRSHGGLPLSQAQATAIRHLVSIHSHMGERDRRIVWMVCGEGHWPSEAVRSVCADYRDTVPARFREALDSLIEAMEMARRQPGVVAI